MALGNYVLLAQRASDVLHRQPENSQAQMEYNFATARCIELMQKAHIDPWGQRSSIPTGEGQYVLIGRENKELEQHSSSYQLIPADTLRVAGTYFRTLVKINGLGAPVVAVGQTETNSYREDFGLKRMYAGLTAIIRFSGRTAEVELVQPLQTEQITLAGNTFQVAADFSTPMAMFMARERPQRLGFIRAIRPDRYRNTALLIRLQPYDPNRTPVLFVHGLQDTPANWAPMICDLLNDREIRRRYQFWVFSYPSGYPYAYSAALLRKELDAIADAFPHHKKIVLVGHSLGGLVARLMVTDSGDRLWRAAFGTAPGNTRPGEPSNTMARDSLIFQHRADVQRVIFMATPHRGSELASGFIGRMASRIVKMPRFVLDFRNSVMALADTDRAAVLLRTIPNSINTASPDHWLLKELNAIGITPDVPYHSVIGNHGRGDTQNSTDGVVPYWSSHLDGAKSERIVPSDHRVQLNAEGIAEVHRILRTSSGGQSQ